MDLIPHRLDVDFGHRERLSVKDSVSQSNWRGRGHEIFTPVLPRREETGLHVQERVRRDYGRDRGLLRGAEEERSSHWGGGTRISSDGHDGASSQREVVR